MRAGVVIYGLITHVFAWFSLRIGPLSRRNNPEALRPDLISSARTLESLKFSTCCAIFWAFNCPVVRWHLIPSSLSNSEKREDSNWLVIIIVNTSKHGSHSYQRTREQGSAEMFFRAIPSGPRTILSMIVRPYPKLGESHKRQLWYMKMDCVKMPGGPWEHACLLSRMFLYFALLTFDTLSGINVLVLGPSEIFRIISK